MDIVAKRLQFEQDNMSENNERNSNYSSSPENNRVYKKDNIPCKLSSNDFDLKNIDNDLVYDSDGDVFGTPKSNLSTDEDFSDYEDVDNTESNEMQRVDIFING